MYYFDELPKAKVSSSQLKILYETLLSKTCDNYSSPKKKIPPAQKRSMKVVILTPI